MFLGVYPFIPVCPIFWKIIIVTNSYDPLFSYDVIAIFPLSLLILYMSLLFISLAEVLLILSFQRASFLFY